MIDIEKPIVIDLQPEWFENGYYVYVVVIRHNEENYYYIGMTGDRRYIMARSPFYRMGGHFALGVSTENQIIKGIREKFGLEPKDDNVLSKLKFTYYAWKIKPFYNNIDKDIHAENRRITEKIESGLIVMCKEKLGNKKVFNHHVSIKKHDGHEEEVQSIYNQLIKLVSENE